MAETRKVSGVEFATCFQPVMTIANVYGCHDVGGHGYFIEVRPHSDPSVRHMTALWRRVGDMAADSAMLERVPEEEIEAIGREPFEKVEAGE